MQLDVTDGGQEEDTQFLGVEHDVLDRGQRHWYVDDSGTDHYRGPIRGAHGNHAAGGE